MADYEKLTDEELDAIIEGRVPMPSSATAAPGKGSEAVAQRNAIARQIEAKQRPVEDNTMGMSGWQLALAGAGSDLNEMGQGIKEKAQIAFRPEGQEGDQVLRDIAAERADRARINKMLYSNPEAVAGRFGSQALMAAAAPARLPAQMALAGVTEFARPGVMAPKGIGGELTGAAAHGGIGAGTMWGIGQGLKMAGKGLGASLGQLTPEGEAALTTKGAAERLGLPPTSLGQLYPNSSMGAIERSAPGMGYSDRTLRQAEALKGRLDRPMQTPEGLIPDPGRAYVDELANAARAREALGSDKYRAVDDFVASQGLGQLAPTYTARTITNTRNPGYPVASDLLGRYGFDAGSMAGMNATALGKIPLSFENYHQMRVATNKALNTLERGMMSAERQGASIPAENRAARDYLRDLKTALDNDAERWAQKHASNEEALGLYKDATAYYRDVVAPTVLENPLARKAMSGARGFKTGAEGLRASQTDIGDALVSRLEPTMTPLGLDLTTVLRGLPDVRKTVLSHDMSVPQTAGGLAQAAKAVVGHPLTAAETAISRLPGLRALSESTPAARFVGARNVLEGAVPTLGVQAPLRARLAPAQGVAPRLAYGSAQYPQDETDRKARRLLGVR